MKLIPKDAVMAEIERLLDKGKYHEEYDCAYRDGNNGALYALKGKLDSLEVKEVDLKGEASIRDELLKYLGSYSSRDFAVAKHFFELSIKAQKGEKV